MAKRQTRKSISVKGITYQRILNALRNGALGEAKSGSDYLERLIAADMDRRGVPEPTTVEPRTPKPEPEPESGEDIISQHFSF